MTPVTEPDQLYRGADTCDLVPDWCDTDPELLALLRACHEADPDELTPQLVLADWLGERDDPRETWVRVGCDLWAACGRLEPGRADWGCYPGAKAALSPACETGGGWRLAGLWGHLVAWHCPSGYGTPMGRTWVDERVRTVNRCIWWWTLGFIGSQADAARCQADAARCQAYAARRQADAAGSQAYAAGRQADAARCQAYAAGSQADAAGRQADAAGRQADAAGLQAYAARRQADAAGHQAYAAGRQAYAAGRMQTVWRFARSAWLLCEAKLPALSSTGRAG